MYTKHGYIKAVKGQKETLLSYLLKASEGMKEIPECIMYLVGLDIEDSDKIYVYEVWKSKDAHLTSLSNPVFIELIQHARPLIHSMESYPDLVMQGGKGL